MCATQRGLLVEPGASSRLRPQGSFYTPGLASGYAGWRACDTLSALLPLILPQTPRGRQGPAGSEVRGPGGRQAHGFGLRLFKTLGLCPGDQLTGFLPIPTLLGAYSPPRPPEGGLFPGPRLPPLPAWCLGALPERSGELGLCCRKITSREGFLWPIFASSC